MRCYLAILAAFLLAIESRAANVEPVRPKTSESLGNRLLDDLAPGTPTPVAPQPQTSPTNRLGIGGNPISQPLHQVRQGMQSAQVLLAQPGLDAKGGAVRLAGAVQQKVLSGLDQLIAQLSKQCQGGPCSAGSDSGDKPSEKSGEKSSKAGSAKGIGKAAARDSTDRLDRTTAQRVDKGEVNEMVKAIWGQLPQRTRDEMQQSFSDEFLPQYELEIEQYYRRLSEEPNNAPPP